MSLTPEAVQALAPDAASLAAGKKLATPAKWPTLAVDGDVLWGEAQGSGRQPYLVAADLRTPDLATRCSCPSRKFPCKHALGLLLLHVGGGGNWQVKEAPEVIGKWLAGRVARAENREKAAGAEPGAADPAQQARRQAAREKKMDAGLAALERWLGDLVREGLLAARKRSYGEWDAQAKRMVDAQLPGVARRIHGIPELLHEEGAERLTAQLGSLYLLTQAWKRRAELSEPERADLMTALGMPLDRSATAPSPTTRWLCAGSAEDQEGRLTVRRTWLLGDGGEVAALLDFAPQGSGLSAGYPPLTRLSGTLAYVPSALPQRAVLSDVAAGGTQGLPARACSLSELAQRWAAALARQPWLERLGLLVGPVYFGEDELCDFGGHALPLSDEVSSQARWDFRARAGTEPAYVFGEWDGQRFRPLTVTPESEATSPTV